MFSAKSGFSLKTLMDIFFWSIFSTVFKLPFFNNKDEKSKFLDLASQKSQKHSPSGIDYFVYNKEYLKAEEFYKQILSINNLQRDLYNQALFQLSLITNE